MKIYDYDIKYALCPIKESPGSNVILGYMISKAYVINKTEDNKYKVFFPYAIYPGRLKSLFTKHPTHIEKKYIQEVDQVFNSYEEAKEIKDIKNQPFQDEITNDPIGEALKVLEENMIVEEEPKTLKLTKTK